MDAAPYLVEIADALAEAKLEAILIGNAGAALQGAPVTTVDFDFFYRESQNDADAKIRQVAANLNGAVTQPFPALSSVYRIHRVEPELQVDLTASIHGAKSFNSLRSRCSRLAFEGRTIMVASLADIIKSRRKRIVPTIAQFCMSLSEHSKSKPARKMTKREQELEIMRTVWEQDLVDMIRARLALPMHKRTNFLRKRLPNGGSAL